MANENAPTVGFKREDIAFDDGCEKCGNSVEYVNVNDPEDVLCENDRMSLNPRDRADYVRVGDVPSGKLSADERIDSMLDEYELEEDVELEIPPNAGSAV